MTFNPKKQFNFTFIALRVAVCWAALFAVFLFVFANAKAENMITYSDLDNYFNSIAYHDTAFDAYYEQAKAECPYFYTAEFTWQGDKWIQIFFSEYDGMTYSTFRMNSNAAYLTYGGDFVFLRNIESVPTGSKIYVISGSPNTSDHCVMRVNTKGDRLYYPNGYYGYRGYCYYYDRTTLYGSGLYMENPSSPVFKYIKGEFNFFYNYSDHILENNFLTYTDDERLKFYTTYAQNGEDLLTTDITEFVEDFPIQDSSHSSMDLVDGTITLTVDSDGTLTTYEITAVNSQTTTTKYKFITPYSYFDLLGDDVKIINCSFSLSGSGQGIEPYSESYYISCEYWLKRTHFEIEAGYVDDPVSIYEDILTQEEIDSINENIKDMGSEYSAGNFQYVLSLPELEGWVTQDFHQLFYEHGVNDVFYEYPDIILFKYKDNDFKLDPYQYIYDNGDSQYFDVLIFSITEANWIGTIQPNDPPESSVFKGYFIFYTGRYYQRLDALNQVSILQVLQDDAKQQVENWKWLVDRLNDFEDKSIDFYNMSITDNATSLGWLSTINNSINSLEFPVFDDSSILDKLDNILLALTGSIEENEIDTPQECVQFYLDNENSDLDNISLSLRPAFFEGATLEFLYSLVSEGSEEDVSRASMRDGSSNSSFNIIWKLYNIIRSVYRNSAAGETITFVLDDMSDSNSYYNALFSSDFDPNNWGYLYE